MVAGGAVPEGEVAGVMVGNAVSVSWLVAVGGTVPVSNGGTEDGKVRLGSIPGSVSLGDSNPSVLH